MSWQDEQENKWILFCLRLLASIPLPGLRVWLGGNGLSHRGGTIQNQSMQYHTKPHKTIQTIANKTNNIPYQYHSKPYRTTTEVETAWLRLHTTDAFLPQNFRVQGFAQIFSLGRHTLSYLFSIKSDSDKIEKLILGIVNNLPNLGGEGIWPGQGISRKGLILPVWKDSDSQIGAFTSFLNRGECILPAIQASAQYFIRWICRWFVFLILTNDISNQRQGTLSGQITRVGTLPVIWGWSGE